MWLHCHIPYNNYFTCCNVLMTVVALNEGIATGPQMGLHRAKQSSRLIQPCWIHTVHADASPRDTACLLQNLRIFRSSYSLWRCTGRAHPGPGSPFSQICPENTARGKTSLNNNYEPVTISFGCLLIRFILPEMDRIV